MSSEERVKAALCSSAEASAGKQKKVAYLVLTKDAGGFDQENVWKQFLASHDPGTWSVYIHPYALAHPTHHTAASTKQKMKEWKDFAAKHGGSVRSVHISHKEC